MVSGYKPVGAVKVIRPTDSFLEDAGKFKACGRARR